MDSATISRAIHDLPKTELHVHLEGSIRPETLMELAKRNGVALPYQTLNELKNWFSFRTFDHFITVYLTITRCLKTAGDYELIVLDYAREALRQNIRYAEMTFSPGTHRWLGVKDDVYLEGLRRGRHRARNEFGVTINWIFDIVRNAENPREQGDLTLALALENRNEGVVALGLGGKEEGHPPDFFAPWFQRARSEGLHSCPHAGEGLGAESVRAAVEKLGAERIGHGIRAIEDPAVVKLLRDQKIPLEICPTSNICLGIYPDYALHPLKKLFDEGVIVTVHSDDPPLFGTTLEREYGLLASEWNMDLTTIQTIAQNSFRHAFSSSLE